MQSSLHKLVSFNYFVLTLLLHNIVTPSSESDKDISLVMLFSVVAACVITNIIMFFISKQNCTSNYYSNFLVFTIWYLKKNRNQLSKTITLSKTIVPQHNTIAPQQNTIVLQHKEDNNSLASMSAIKIIEQSQVQTDYYDSK